MYRVALAISSMPKAVAAQQSTSRAISACRMTSTRKPRMRWIMLCLPLPSICPVIVPQEVFPVNDAFSLFKRKFLCYTELIFEEKG